MKNVSIRRRKMGLDGRGGHAGFLFTRQVVRIGVITVALICGSCPKHDEGPGLVWEHSFGGSGMDWGYSVQQTADGGFVVAGGTYSFGAGDADVYLIKADSLGTLVWSKTYGGSGRDFGSSVQLTVDGGYVIAGGSSSFGSARRVVYMVKTDASGNLVWQKTHDPGYAITSQAHDVRTTADGGYIMVGETMPPGPEMYMLIIKTDAKGDTQWTRKGLRGAGHSVLQAADGAYVIAGHNGGIPPFPYLVRLSSSGDTIWSKTLGGQNSGWFESIGHTADGGYILAGWQENAQSGSRALSLTKTDANGVEVWTRLFGSGSSGHGVRQTADGGYIVAGTSYEHGQDWAWILKTNPDGDTLWTRIYGGSIRDEARSVLETVDGGYVATGTVGSDSTAEDVLLIKIK